MKKLIKNKKKMKANTQFENKLDKLKMNYTRTNWGQQ